MRGVVKDAKAECLQGFLGSQRRGKNCHGANSETPSIARFRRIFARVQTDLENHFKTERTYGCLSRKCWEYDGNCPEAFPSSGSYGTTRNFVSVIDHELYLVLKLHFKNPKLQWFCSGEILRRL